MSKISPEIIPVADERDEKLKEYFFLSGILYILDVLMEIIRTNDAVNPLYKEMAYIAYKTAADVSADIGVSYPHLNCDESLVTEAKTFHPAVGEWRNDLHQNAKGIIENNWDDLSHLPKN